MKIKGIKIDEDLARTLNEGFISPAEERQIFQCFIRCGQDIDKTIETLRLATTNFEEADIRKVCAYAYVDLASEDWFTKHPYWEEDMPIEAYNNILKGAEEILGEKLRDDYYVESAKKTNESKNEASEGHANPGDEVTVYGMRGTVKSYGSHPITGKAFYRVTLDNGLDVEAYAYDVKATDKKNESFISPAEERQIFQCFIRCGQDIDKTIETLRLATTNFEEADIRKVCAYAYVDLASEDWFTKHPYWEEDMPIEAYNNILKGAEEILGEKLRDDYYVESAKKTNEQDNDFPKGSFAAWYGEDLTGQTYKGNLSCYDRNLTSLFGCPSIVTGFFDCSENQLTSLEGAPKEVRGYFFCSGNQLTSLKGAPKEVGGSFDCFDNKLASLEGAPKEVRGYFGCSYNRLTLLKGAPKEVRRDFDCSHNQLTSLEGAPEKVGDDFDCSNNPNLKSLEGIGKVNGDIISDLKSKKDTKSKKKSSIQSNLSTLDEIKDYMEENDLEEYDLTYDGIKFTFYLEDDDLDYSFESDFVDGSKDELSYKVDSLDDLSDIVPEIFEYEVSYTLDYGSTEDKVKIIVDRSDIVEFILKESEDFDKVAKLLTELNDYYDPDRNNGEFDPYENYNTVEDAVIGLIDLANTID